MLYSCRLIISLFVLAAPAQARIPLSSQLLIRSNYAASRHHTHYQLHASRRGLFGVLAIRGGDSSDSDDSSDIEFSLDDESDQNDELEADGIESASEEEEGIQPETTAEPSIGPVKLTIKTNLDCPISDQSLEFTASGKRTVESLKQAISKTMRGRPPLQTIILKHSGRTLSDDETVSSILSDVDSDDEDSDSEDNIGEEETEKLKLTLDVMPPIDPKFGIDFREKAEKMSTRELLSAYCLNAAGMRLGMELAEIEMDEYDKLLQANEDDEEMEDASKDFKGPTNQSLHIRKQATLLQKQMEKSFGHETLQLMDKEYERVQSYLVEGDKHSSSTGVVFGLVPDAELTQRSRKGRALKGGATMNIKRALQKNMNVNWADTTRNSLLFLFFGYFGGRNSFSRTFLLLSAPLCFFLQTRPVKVAIKQAFYCGALGGCPGILLSLLPAPQQAIMSLDYPSVMKSLYGDDVIKEGWFEDEESDDGIEDDEYDDEDQEYDFDDEY